MNDVARLTDRPVDPFQVGAFAGLSFKTYHSIEAMSFHGSTTILRSPQHYRLDRDEPGESSADQLFGRAVHALVLEGSDGFARDFFVLPKEIDRRTKAGRREMDEALARYKAALAAGGWPGYDPKIRPLVLPRYAVRNSY